MLSDVGLRSGEIDRMTVGERPAYARGKQRGRSRCTPASCPGRRPAGCSLEVVGRYFAFRSNFAHLLALNDSDDNTQIAFYVHINAACRFYPGGQVRADLVYIFWVRVGRIAPLRPVSSHSFTQ